METFLIRLWVPAEEADPQDAPTLHGFVEHPRTEQRWKFTGATGLLERLTQALGTYTPTSIRIDDHDEAISESRRPSEPATPTTSATLE